MFIFSTLITLSIPIICNFKENYTNFKSIFNATYFSFKTNVNTRHRNEFLNQLLDFLFK